MKINLKFGQEQEPVQTGLGVRTLLQAGCGCEKDYAEYSLCTEDNENFTIVKNGMKVKAWIKDHCPKQIST